MTLSFNLNVDPKIFKRGRASWELSSIPSGAIYNSQKVGTT
jgi:hypothetical protein